MILHADPLRIKEILYNFDLKPRDVFFWFSDIGWMMGPWEIIGCLMHAGTIVIFEGAPDYPQPCRYWSMVQQHQATILGLAPTLARGLRRHGDAETARHDFSSLRLATCGSAPLSPKLWREVAALPLEARLSVAAALAAISKEDRRLLRLRFVDELTQNQIARRLGVSQMQVSRRLRRSLERLRALVARLGEDHHTGPRSVGRETDRLKQLEPIGVQRRVEDEHVG